MRDDLLTRRDVAQMQTYLLGQILASMAKERGWEYPMLIQEAIDETIDTFDAISGSWADAGIIDREDLLEDE